VTEPAVLARANVAQAAERQQWQRGRAVTAISNLAQAAILKIIAQATGATLKWRFDAAVHECRGCPVRAEGNECGLATAAREPPESLRPVDARYGSIR
jgi:hypothetical protein